MNARCLLQHVRVACVMSVASSKESSMMFTSNIKAQLTPGCQLPKLNVDQMTILEDNFKRNRNPNDFDISLISAEAGLPEADVKVKHLCTCFYMYLHFIVVFLCAFFLL